VQVNFEKVQHDSSNELETLRAANANSEEELTNALTGWHEVQEQLIVLKQEVQERRAQDGTERENMQDLMSRLEANGTAVAQKQKEIEERENIIREAGNDVQARLEELIKLVRRSQLAADVPA
jgi:hypothetical protein